MNCLRIYQLGCFCSIILCPLPQGLRRQEVQRSKEPSRSHGKVKKRKKSLASVLLCVCVFSVFFFPCERLLRAAKAFLVSSQDHRAIQLTNICFIYVVLLPTRFSLRTSSGCALKKKKKKETLFFFFYVLLCSFKCFEVVSHGSAFSFSEKLEQLFFFLPPFFIAGGGGQLRSLHHLFIVLFFFLDKTCHLALSCMSPSFFFYFCAF